MRRYVLAAGILAFLVTRLYAGGSHYEAEILDFKAKGNDEFAIVVRQHNDPYDSSADFKAREITIHLRHRTDKCKKTDFISAVNLLLVQFQKGGKFFFGVIGQGYVPIEGKKDEYQSNGLRELEEHDGRKVVFSAGR